MPETVLRPAIVASLERTGDKSRRVTLKCDSCTGKTREVPDVDAVRDDAVIVCDACHEVLHLKPFLEEHDEDA